MDAGYPEDELRAKEQFHQVLAEVQVRIAGISESVASEVPTETTVASLVGLAAELGQLAEAYHAQLNSFAERKRRMEKEASLKEAMAEKRSTTTRDESQIQKLSEELTTGLRLDRVDAAMKELLDFLADADFFAANASTGRRRRLRALQNAIDKALQK